MLSPISSVNAQGGVPMTTPSRTAPSASRPALSRNGVALASPLAPRASSGHPWRDRYVRRIAVADAGCALVATLVGYVVRFGPPQSPRGHADIWLAAFLPAVWLFAMLVARSYEKRFLWLGAEEFRRIFFASALLLATVGTLSWALRLEVARGFVIVAVPLTTVLTLGQRYAQRKTVHRQRRRGRYIQTVLLVGHGSGVAALHEEIEREPFHGYRVSGCCLPDASRTVRLRSDGPVFFRQQRVGRDGRTFTMLKFRTMRADAEATLHELAGASEGNGVLFKMRNDLRVTPIGRVLRRYSLDECRSCSTSSGGTCRWSARGLRSPPRSRATGWTCIAGSS